MNYIVVCVGVTDQFIGTDSVSLDSLEHIGLEEVKRIFGGGNRYGKGVLPSVLKGVYKKQCEGQPYGIIFINKNEEDNKRVPKVLQDLCPKSTLINSEDTRVVFEKLKNHFLDIDKENTRILVVGTHTEKMVLLMSLYLKNVLGINEVAVSSHLMASATQEGHQAAIGNQFSAFDIDVFLNLYKVFDYLNIELEQDQDKSEVNPCEIFPMEISEHLDDKQKRIIELICLRWNKAFLKRLAGGFSGSQLFLVSGQKKEYQTEPMVIKIDSYSQMKKELNGYYQIKDLLGKNVPTFSFPVSISDYIGVGMELATMEGNPQTLEDSFRNSKDEHGQVKFLLRFEKALDIITNKLYSNTKEKTYLSPYRYFLLHTEEQRGFLEMNSKTVLGYCQKEVPAELHFDGPMLETLFKLVSRNEGEILTDVCLVHGDLNYANMICDNSDNVWFIDWTHAKESPIELDFAKLENDVKYVISDEFGVEDLANVRKFEEYLVEQKIPEPLNRLGEEFNFVKKDPRFRKIYDVVRKIRERCFLLKEDKSWIVYKVALLRYSLHTVSFNKRLNRGQCELPQLMQAFYATESLLYNLVADDFHLRIRTERPSSYPKRYELTIDEAPWVVESSNYHPPYYVDPSILNDPHSDPEDFSKIKTEFKELGVKYFDDDGKPLNPAGRTGLAGRGILSQWGPNNMIYPFIFRTHSKNSGLEVLLAQKKSLKEFSTPRKLVPMKGDYESSGKQTVQEAFGLSLRSSSLKNIPFGYLYDHRQTDHSWINAIGMIYFLSQDEQEAELKFNEKYDNVSWYPLNHEIINQLPSGQSKIIRKVVESLIQLNRLDPQSGKILLEKTQ